MGKSIHPVAALEEGNPGAAIHPRLFVARTEIVGRGGVGTETELEQGDRGRGGGGTETELDLSLELSELPRSDSWGILATSLVFSGLMLLAGCGATALVLVKGRSESWSMVVGVAVVTAGAFFAVTGIVSLISMPGKLSDCAHEVIEVGPDTMTVRRVVRGIRMSSKRRGREAISSVRLHRREAADGSTSSACAIVEGQTQMLVCRRLPEAAQRRVLELLSEALKVPVGEDEVTR